MPALDPAEKLPAPIAYLDTSATSALTGISESTLEKQRLTGGGIPFIKAGRLVKYSAADIHAWMAARRRCSTSEGSAMAATSLERGPASHDKSTAAKGWLADNMRSNASGGHTPSYNRGKPVVTSAWDLRAPVLYANGSGAELAFAVHQTLVRAELANPAIAQNAYWVSLRSVVFDFFVAEFEAGR